MGDVLRGDEMTERSSLAAKPVLILAALSVLGGCGVKNLPVAPDTNEVPAVVAEQTQGGTTKVLGSGETGTAVRAARISDVQNDNMVSAAEVTRNKDASGKRFFLDPLLN